MEPPRWITKALCLCEIFFSLLAMILPTKIRSTNSGMILCLGKCGSWMKVKLSFHRDFNSKTNFSGIWDL